MTRRMFRVLIASGALSLATAALLSVSGCEMVQGGGTDVGNPDLSMRVSGSLRNVDGTPAALKPIHLRPKSHLGNPDAPAAPDASIQDRISDTQGFFTFDSVPKGEYRIEAMDSQSHGALFEFVADGKNAALSIGNLVLDSTGTITGQINYVRPIKVGYPKIIIAVYGTDRWTAATLDGKFTLSDLPPGRYKLHASTNTDSDTTFTAEFPETELHAGENASVGSVDLGG
jgi:hypothetical protein